MEIANLDQLRAKHAYDAANSGKNFGGKEAGNIVKKIPSMIRENGFLATLAFALEKGGGHETVLNAIAEHLNKLPRLQSSNARNMLTELCEGDSAKLRDVTAEAQLYMNFLRRFVKNADKEK